MNILKKFVLTVAVLATVNFSVAFSNTTKVSAWAYNVNKNTASYINYQSVITTGNPENQQQ